MRRRPPRRSTISDRRRREIADLPSVERCPGCGRTPCVPDARGLCPDRPDDLPGYLDDSWGDFERDEDLP